MRREQEPAHALGDVQLRACYFDIVSGPGGRPGGAGWSERSECSDGKKRRAARIAVRTSRVVISATATA